MRASDKAYESLKEDILQWRLVPGSVLSESEQSARLGISRTPLREAITRLAGEGLVDTARGRAGVVTEVSEDRLVELFELREALETQASRIAARRRSLGAFEPLLADFGSAAVELERDAARPERTAEGYDDYYALVARLDGAIDDAVGNSYLLAALRAMRGHIARARRLARDNPKRLAESAGEHQLIVQAIVDRDEALAVHATAVHLRKSLDNVLASVRSAGPVTPQPVQPAARGGSPKGTP